MTDEEMAEEYVKSNNPEWELEGELECHRTNREVKQAFLAGLEAGRPKWHKVADGDLPNENVKLILVRDRWKNHFLNYHLLLNKMIVEMIDQFDEWIELPIEE